VTSRLSFFMASKNRKAMIPDAIASVQAQLFDDWELVICDGSDEPYPPINDPRVKVFHQPNGGPAEGFQIALDHCRGEFVFPLADDDLLTEHAGAVAVAALAGTGKQWGYGLTSFEQAGEQVMVLGDVFDLERLRQSYYLGGAVFWRRALTDRIGGFDKNFDGAADYDLYLRMAEDSVPVVVPMVLYRYNDHEGTDSRVNAARQGEATQRIATAA
jgi:glycosyltransferase involved in cell wall biosynthesis